MAKDTEKIMMEKSGGVINRKHVSVEVLAHDDNKSCHLSCPFFERKHGLMKNVYCCLYNALLHRLHEENTFRWCRCESCLENEIKD